ncbi:MAG: hypothetical protein AB1411_14340 [Nitrospirota bacterium]
MSPLLPSLFALTAGFYFAVCQVGYFVHLQFHLSSTFVSYYTTIGVWLLGGLLGLFVRVKRLEFWMVAAGLGAYYAQGLVLRQHPYDLRWLPVYLLFVFATAVYSGYFFRRARAAFPSAKSLFFHENNGFLLGCFVALIELLLKGQVSQQVLPALGAVGHLAMLALLHAGWPGRNAPVVAHTSGSTDAP